MESFPSSLLDGDVAVNESNRRAAAVALISWAHGAAVARSAALLPKGKAVSLPKAGKGGVAKARAPPRAAALNAMKAGGGRPVGRSRPIVFDFMFQGQRYRNEAAVAQRAAPGLKDLYQTAAGKQNTLSVFADDDA